MEKVWTHGPLLRYVQLSGRFKDDKDFVYAPEFLQAVNALHDFCEAIDMAACAAAICHWRQGPRARRF